jgi:hypothetical protein
LDWPNTSPFGFNYGTDSSFVLNAPSIISTNQSSNQQDNSRLRQ